MRSCLTGQNVSFAYFFGNVSPTEVTTNQQLLTHFLVTAVNPEEENASCPGSREPEIELAVNDLLKSIVFQGGVHVFMVACGIGVNCSARGDEMMGLVPALFHVGASTLWPVACMRAAEWTRFMLMNGKDL